MTQTIANSTVLAAVVAGAVSLISLLIGRHDGVRKDIADLAADVKELRADIGRGRAISARIRILTASDEVVHGVKHSREWWDQVLDDCTFYEHYCEDNPDFKNKKAVHAIEHLNEVYITVYREKKFV